jgi:hypothetical protein
LLAAFFGDFPVDAEREKSFLVHAPVQPS